MNLANLRSLIDTGADSIVRDVVGNRTEEYRTAESEAQAYKDAGYTGQAGANVNSWALAQGWTDQQAADDILATAASWRGALEAIRAKRLLLKAQARNGADLDVALAQWLAFERFIRSQLGV
jgi:hypothetical protein